MISSILATIQNKQTLSPADTRIFLNEILAGEVTPAQTGAFLMGLAQRGETPDEILGAAQVLREHVTPIQAPEGAMDCCGTGGDHANTLNISTAVAFVLAGCGVPVAKHGNRAASSKSGAADVLEALDVPLNLSPAQCADALTRFGYCFLMAPHHHKVLKPLATLRKELGFRTLFNALGPLANPAETRYQLMGVYDKRLVHPMASVLHELGSVSAIVVHGLDGLDEVTLTGPTLYTRLHHGVLSDGMWAPDDFGLPTIESKDIRGGDAATNAVALTALLNGTASAYRNVVLANAAAGLMVTGKVANLKDGVAMAAQSIDSGAARKVFTDYRDYAKTVA